MKTYQTIFLILFSFGMLALVAMVGGCDRTPTQSGSIASGLRINASLEQALNGETLDFVRLVISARDMATINEVYPIVDGRYFEAELDVPTGERRFVLTVETIDSLIFTDLGVDTISHAVYRGDVTAIVRPVDNFEIDITLEPVVPLIKLVSRYIEVQAGDDFEVDLVVRNIPRLWQLGVIIDFGYFLDLGYYPEPISAQVSPTQRGSIFFDASLFNDDTQYQVLMFDSSQVLPLPLVDFYGDGTLATIRFRVPHIASATALEIIPLTLEIFVIEDVDSTTIDPATVFRDQSKVDIIPVPDNVVTFPDPALEAAVRYNVSVPTGTDIMLSNLLSTDSFWWDDDGTQIADLTNINLMQNLQYLTLRYQSITDLTPIGQMTNLTDLEVYGMQLVNIGPLQNLTNLRYLNLAYNDIADLTPLQNLPNLQYLDLRYNNITNILPLVNNAELGSGDTVDLTGNVLDNISVSTYLPALRTRKVNIIY